MSLEADVSLVLQLLYGDTTVLQFGIFTKYCRRIHGADTRTTDNESFLSFAQATKPLNLVTG